jgi:hypothetical protein
MIYLYAIVEDLGELPPVSGIDGAPLERRVVDTLEALVSEHSGADVEPSEAAVLDHAQVIEAAMAHSTAVLPAQFGRGFADDDTLEAALWSSHEELTRALERVRSCVEFGIRVLAPTPRPARTTGARSGGEYLRTRLHEVTETEQRTREIHHALAERARESVGPTMGPGPQFLTAAYLVPSGDVDLFGAEVRRLEQTHSQLAFVCTGPWPPYSFAGIAAGV